MSLAPLLSVDDVAAFTGLSAYTIRQAVRDGELPAVKIRGRVRIDPADLLAWVDGHRVEPSNAASSARTVMPASIAPRPRPPEGGYRALAKARRAA